MVTAVASFSLVGACATGASDATGSTQAPVADSSTLPPTLSDRDIADRFGESVYRVEAEGCGFVSIGSAFVVGDGLVITNHHVVENDLEPVLYARTGEVLTAQVLGWDLDLDIAVLRTSSAIGPPLEWRLDGGVSGGDGIVALGYPLPAHDFTVASGVVQSVTVDDDGVRVLRIDASIDYGASGGPAFTRDGRVAGVVTAVDPNPGGLSIVPLVISSTDVSAIVPQLEDQEDPLEVNCESVPPADVGSEDAVASLLSCPTMPDCWVAAPAVDSAASLMPQGIRGYRPDGSLTSTEVNVFGTWEYAFIPFDFPYVLNGCATQLWTARWRTVYGEAVHGIGTNPPLDLYEVRTWDGSEGGDLPEAAPAGFLAGFGCTVPAWFFDDGDPDVTVIADLVVEWQMWVATP